MTNIVDRYRMMFMEAFLLINRRDKLAPALGVLWLGFPKMVGGTLQGFSI